MANVNIKFNGRDYLLSCDDGQETNLKSLAGRIDKRFNNLKKKLGNIGESKLLLISAIQIEDDFFDLSEKINRSKSEFSKLSDKFKNLRSLAIEYKVDKDKEIEKLNLSLENLKNMAEENQNSYENLLDKTTKSIQDFLESSKSLQ